MTQHSSIPFCCRQALLGLHKDCLIGGSYPLGARGLDQLLGISLQSS